MQAAVEWYLAKHRAKLMTRFEAKRIALDSRHLNLRCAPVAPHERRVDKYLRFIAGIWAQIRNLRSLHLCWAYKALSRAMQKDRSYALAWHANIAMPIYDASGGRVDRDTANRMAAAVMRHLFATNTENI